MLGLLSEIDPVGAALPLTARAMDFSVNLYSLSSLSSGLISALTMHKFKGCRECGNLTCCHSKESVLSSG